MCSKVVQNNVNAQILMGKCMIYMQIYLCRSQVQVGLFGDYIFAEN